MMRQFGERRWQTISWGAVVSIALHALIAAVLFVQLPSFEHTPPAEESVSVELVPPPEETAEASVPEEAPPEEPRAEEEQEQAEPPTPAAEASPEQDPATPPAEDVPIPVLRPVLEFGETDTGSLDPEPDDIGRKAPTPAELEAEETPVETAASETETTPETETASPVPEDVALPELGESEDPPAPAENADPASPAEAVADAGTADAAEPAAASAEPLTAAEKLYSASATDDPVARTAMGDLPRGTRIERLCSTELYAQLRHGSPSYRPELLPSFRLSQGTVLDVRRAAFRANTRWYDLSFRCEVDADATRVVSFAFDVGAEVPESQWRNRGFPAL